MLSNQMFRKCVKSCVSESKEKRFTREEKFDNLPGLSIEAKKAQKMRKF